MKNSQVVLVLDPRQAKMSFKEFWNSYYWLTREKAWAAWLQLIAKESDDGSS